jgi:hypothetical protein
VLASSSFNDILPRDNGMQLKSTTVAPALRALLESFIDYAGVFPPAALTADVAIANYDSYCNSSFSWMLRSFVIGGGDLQKMPKSLDGKLAVLAEADESRAASIESKSVISAKRPVYCEVSTGNLSQLQVVKQSGSFAKIRTGGLTPEAIPSPEHVAAFISACADLRLAFKATAGLHHPIRAPHALTYEPNAPVSVMHGFLNVLMAAAFAWHGDRLIEPIISETDPQAFSFNDHAHWRDKSLSAEQIREARKQFMHSVGSCSFEEPVQELQELGLLNRP